MGTIKQGILGGFSGKVGTVIGSSWKGIAYMRGQAQSIKNPKTEGQTNQRNKFTLVLAFLQSIMSFIKVGYKSHAQKQSAFNAAMSYILKNAVTGTAPDYAINYANVLVSRGSLTAPEGAAALAASGKVTITWNDNSGIGLAASTDKAMVVLFDEDKGEAVTTTEGAARNAETLDQAVPAAWEGDTVHAYIAFIAADGSIVSDSVYAGSVTAA